ncbi:predicted protein [Nematostella vectensis]|uniref:J domain-containing protein n=1 Tax=Nematostella vectensis TaxID=45351 RepID=A7SC40_NEMVE|nr:predicted protein [Nematostella vectensis]|eukprot:XP_001630804.1 predicted protein [Nematostella vectensis]
MGRNYYAILGVPRNASDDDIKKAYRRQALIFHPDKNKNSGAEEKFKEISEAYKVLTDPRQRDIFDMYGEEGLKGTSDSPFGGPCGGFGFSFSEDPMKIFAEVFRDEEPFKETGNFSSYSTGQKGFGFEGMDFGPGPDPFKKEGPIQEPAVEKILPVSLEELYIGSVRKLRINHQVLSMNNEYIREDKILQIEVKPGWKAGTKITFPREGDMKPGIIASDIIFIIADKPHQFFKRDSENNLIYVSKLTLKDALVGCVIQVPTIDGRVLSIQVNEVIRPGMQKRIQGEGLPLSKNPIERADLIVTFEVEFPTNLTGEQREYLASLPF